VAKIKPKSLQTMCYMGRMRQFKVCAQRLDFAVGYARNRTLTISQHILLITRGSEV